LGSDFHNSTHDQAQNRALLRQTQTLNQINSGIKNFEQASLPVLQDTSRGIDKIEKRMDEIHENGSKQFEILKNMVGRLQKQLEIATLHDITKPTTKQNNRENKCFLPSADYDSIEVLKSIKRLARLANGFQQPCGSKEEGSVVRDLQQLLDIALARLDVNGSGSPPSKGYETAVDGLDTSARGAVNRIQGLLESSKEIVVNHEGMKTTIRVQFIC
jgi:hypothetical protein